MLAEEEIRVLRHRVRQAKTLAGETDDPLLQRSILNHITDLEGRISKLLAATLPAATTILPGEPSIGPELAATFKQLETMEATNELDGPEKSDEPGADKAV
jgi:hypothetical protein